MKRNTTIEMIALGREQANPNQDDTDQDGFGDWCDADFNNDGIVDTSDFYTWASCFGERVPGTGPADDPICAESDMDGNMAVGISDFGLWSQGNENPPGPSGLSCADPTIDVQAGDPACP